IHGIHIGPGVHQFPDNGGVAVHGSEIEWSDAVAVCDFDVCSCANEAFDFVEIVGADGPMQRSRSVWSRGIDVFFFGRKHTSGDKNPYQACRTDESHLHSEASRCTVTVVSAVNDIVYSTAFEGV